MLTSVRNTVRSLSRLGVAEGTPPFDAKYIVLCNTVAITAWVLVPLGVPTISHGLPTLSIALLWAQLAIWTGPLVLNWRGHHGLAAVWLCIGGLVVFVGQIFLLGPQMGHPYWLLLVGIAPFFLFPPRQRHAGLFVLVCAAASFVLVQVYRDDIAAAAPPFAADARLVSILITSAAFLAAVLLAYQSRAATLRAEAQVEVDRERAHSLLLNVLPEQIVERLKHDPKAIAEAHPEVTVLFADLVGFTPLAEQRSPAELVDILNQVFSRFDALVDEHGLEKIKTIGDEYMVAGGLPEWREDHCEAVARLALAMPKALDDVSGALGIELSMRIGFHTGSVVAGVLGVKKFSYDLWGDTVNTASRMESHAQAGTIQVTQAVRDKLAPAFTLEPRGEVEIKGKGTMQTFVLEGAP